MKSLLYLLLQGLLCTSVNAFPSFLSSRTEVFHQSCDQLICRQLRSEVPRFFDCSFFFKDHSFDSPSSASPFSGIPVSPNEMARENFKSCYLPQNDCSVFLTLKSLCDLYFPLIERKLDQYKLPREYKYLPLILSGLNPHYSDNSGRTGFWAMDYWVARRQGLRVDSLIDERRGADFTTDKALSYLSNLHHQFKGDNAKTLIAYFRSNTYVHQILNDFPSTEFTEAIDDDCRTFLQFLDYTAQIFSSVQVENQLSNYFDILGAYESLFFTSDVSLGALQQITRADLPAIRQINPVYTGSFIEGDYRKVPYLLKKESAELFHLHETEVYLWKPPVPAITEERIIHNVKKGDSLGKIAARYNVSVQQLKSWNGLKRESIKPGQKIVIIKKSILRKEEVPVETNDKNSPDVEIISPDSMPVTPKEKINPPKAGKDSGVINYKVRPGDSLWTISKKYKGVTPEKIMKWNNCGEQIRPGQILKIHTLKQ